MADEPIRLGGMALTNGVLVHGPNSWSCAIRLPDGRLEVAAELKRFRASEVTNPLFRGPARLAEAISLLPTARRRLPGMKLPFERPRVLTAMIAGAAVTQIARGSKSLSPAAREVVAGDRLARSGRDRPAQLGARRLPRRGAHRDRHVRARRGAATRSTSAVARTWSARSSARS